jgi:hypothetical protein
MRIWSNQAVVAIYRFSLVFVWFCGALGLLPSGPVAAEDAADERSAEVLLFQIEPMLVTPSHGPILFVAVKNPGGRSRKGTLRLKTPEGWLLSPPEHEVEISPDQVVRVAFNVQRAKSAEENRYPIQVSFREEGKPDVTVRQEVVVATAPYSAPNIDGEADDWADSVPVRSVQEDGSSLKETVVKTFWSRRAFSVLVEVEEDRLRPAVFPGSDDEAAYGDAVQLAFGAEKPGQEGFEYLIVAGGGEGGGTCYRLVKQEDHVVWNPEAKAKCRVTREGKTTRYECSIPWGPMRDVLRPSEGRAFCFSFLVHDPDGTGVRDWGASVGLWPSQRDRNAWSIWWKPVPEDWSPYTARIPWGMCSSKY